VSVQSLLFVFGFVFCVWAFARGSGEGECGDGFEVV